MGANIIETNHLSKIYKGTHAVKSVDLKVKEGEIYGFLGPNGAGKTTTIRMLLGLIKPTSGTIKMFNKDLKEHRIDILRNVGSLVESPSYYGKLTARENLEIVKKITKGAKENINNVLEIVQLAKAEKKVVNQFSLGMKQRLAIAMALVVNPKLLILDEPTNGLDPSGIQEMRELIKSLPKQYGISVVVSSHLLSEIEQIATQVGIINDGKMIFQDTISKLKEESNPEINVKTSDITKAHKLLLEHDYRAIQMDNGLQIPKYSDETIAQIIRLLVDHHISVYRIEEHKLSLEQIFLDLTRKVRG